MQMLADDRDPPEPSPITAFSRWRRVLLIAAIFSANFAAALIYDVLPPIMSDLAAQFGGGAQGQFVAQLASTFPLFGVMAAGLVAGPVIERIGIRAALLGAMALFAISGSAGVGIDIAWLFLVTRFLMGVAIGLMTTACTSLVALCFRGPARARMNGWLVSVGSIAGIGFVLIAGWTAGWWWRAPFLLHGAVALLFLVPVLMIGAVPAAAPGSDDRGSPLRRLRPMLPVCVAGFAMFAAMLMGGTQTPFLMALAGLGDHGTIAGLYALNAAAVMVSSASYGLFAARFSPIIVLRSAFVLLAVAMIVTGSAASVEQFAVGLILSGTAVGIGLTALWTWAMRRAPADLVPRALGAMTTCLYFGGAISPILSLPFRLTLGLRGQYFGVALLILIAVAVIPLVQRHILRPPSVAAPVR